MNLAFAVVLIASMTANTVLAVFLLRSWRIIFRGTRNIAALEDGLRYANRYFFRCMKAEDAGRDPRVDADAQRAYRVVMAGFRATKPSPSKAATHITKPPGKDVSTHRVGDTDYVIRWDAWRFDGPQADN